ETATSPHAIDPIVTVLRAETADGDPIGAFYSFALHGTSIGGGNDLFSGDNMGPAMRVCEQELAARAPGRPAPVCAQASGAEGDVSPRADDASLHVHGDFAKAAATGGIVARGVLAAWDAAQVRDDITLDARFKILYFRGQDGDVGKPTSPVPMVGVGGNFGDGLGLPFDLPGSGDKIPVGVGAGGYPQYAPLQIVRVGNTALIAVPAEMTVEMARRVRTAVLAAVPEMLGYAAIIGLANSYLSYVTTPEEYAANLYEGAWTLYGPQQGNLLRNEYVRMAEDMAVGQPTDSIAAPPLGSNLALAEETSTEPDDPLRVGTVLAEPDDTPRGELVSFSWIGGNPGADRPRGRTFVRLQRLQPGGASTVATEDDIWSAIRVDRDPRPGAPYRWSARFDLPVDVPAGTYRIEVAGRYSALDHAGNYHVRSRDFVVEPAGALRVIAEVRNNGLGRQVRLTATWGAPTGERYAPRPKAFTGTGSVTYALRRGGEQLAAGTTPFGEWFDVDATITTVHIARGDIVTASGDTNAEQFELAIPD
ncbi:MAG TPA: neutral/alkaline non-lysosomal ceramidase N-terminal domain-containing protein, partial [Actinomycetota bacterium]|nr:neutral/alkaline non-lysosomal ceramidase N-terminal domain-containing protein [Actinomycetota bacterium]